VAQTVVRLVIEPNLEKVFLPDSYGYRPNKSALDAIGVTRKRCWQHDWVLEFDIKGLFDNIPHPLLLKAARKHVKEDWALLYIERWLTAPMELEDGTRVERTKGTPQGGVVSPVMANLFLHYAFDAWMGREHPELPWCRYADDGLVHCRTLEKAEAVKAALQKRLAECGLEMHPDKTRIVYCKDRGRKGTYPNIAFDFLGYMYRPRRVMTSKRDKVSVSFTPAVSGTALKNMRQTVKSLRLCRHSQIELATIADALNPVLRGWVQYYGRYRSSGMNPLYWYVNQTLVRWAMRKYKRLRHDRTRARMFIADICRKNSRLFVHWQLSSFGAYA
jgi:RNA-directed DNA polymerase